MISSDYKKMIIKQINDMSGAKSPYEIFHDWITCLAISIQNSLTIFGNKKIFEVKAEREEQYKRIVAGYEDGERIFGEMGGMLTLAMENHLSDTLGEIYMESGMGSKSTGQFFSPFSVSKITAALTVGDRAKETDGEITIAEPSCGSGGMIIAAAANLLERGINYQQRMRVVAQDLDWKAVYMCYVQLSLLGIKATVVQGDTLTDPYIPGEYPLSRIWRTPAEMGLLIPGCGDSDLSEVRYG